MNDEPLELRRGEHTVSTDRARLDVDMLHEFLSATYWAAGRSRQTLERAIENSLCFGVYHGERQVGFARAITDRATYAYLSDVFIVEAYRGQGLSKWLVACILDHPDLRGIRRVALFTRDAQSLYTRFGFGPSTSDSTYLEIRKANDNR